VPSSLTNNHTRPASNWNQPPKPPYLNIQHSSYLLVCYQQEEKKRGIDIKLNDHTACSSPTSCVREKHKTRTTSSQIASPYKVLHMQCQTLCTVQCVCLTACEDSKASRNSPVYAMRTPLCNAEKILAY